MSLDSSDRIRKEVLDECELVLLASKSEFNKGLDGAEAADGYSAANKAFDICIQDIRNIKRIA